MAERFHLGPGTLAYARALGFEIPSGGHQALALEPEAYYALFENSEAEAATLYPKVIDCFGFATLDPPLLIGLCSENLETAAERMARYKPLIGPLSLTLRRSEATLRLTFDWPNAPAVPALAYAIEALFWVALARKGPLDRQTPLSLSLPMCPPARAKFESVAGLRVTIAEQQEITFTAKAARAPFANRRDDIVKALQDSLEMLAADHNFTATLRGALAAALPAGRATIAHVATDLGISARTLQRRLTDDGTSFRAELTAVRMALDSQLIGVRRYSASEAAFLLGFQDVNSLYRARKLWANDTTERPLQ